MKIVLLSALGVLLGLFLFLCLAYVLIKWKLKKLFGGLGDAFGGLAQGMQTLPQYRMKLAEASDTPLHHPEAMAGLTNELAALGFAEAGTYRAGENAPVLVRGMVHEADRILAAIYDGPDLEPVLDLVRETESGTHLLASNCKTQGLDKPPWTRAEHQLDADVPRLLSVLEGLDARGPFLPVKAESFKPMFEQAYAREMDWRVDRGGYTDDEFRRVVQAAQDTGADGEQEELSEQALMIMRGTMQGALRHSLEEELCETFLAESDLTAADWAQFQHRVEFVHTLSDAESLVGLLSQLEPSRPDNGADEGAEAEAEGRHEKLTADVERAMQFDEPAAVFAKLAPQQPGYAQMKHLAHMDEPSACDVYLMPEAG